MVNLQINDNKYKNIDLIIFDKDGTLFELYPYCSKMVNERTTAISNILENYDQNLYDWLILSMGVDLKNNRIFPEGPIGVYSKFYAQDMLFEKMNDKDYNISKKTLKTAFENADRIINQKEYLKDARDIIKNNPSNYNDAISLFDKAIENDSQCTPAYVWKVLLFRDNKRFRDAIEVMKIMLNRNIRTDYTLWTIGMFYEYIGINDTATIYYKRCYKHLLSEDTNNCYTKINLAACEKLLFDSLIYISPECRSVDPIAKILNLKKSDIIKLLMEQKKITDSI